ncbi:YggS family pyridoxal phosphate-dependent enzyme [Corynebacterium uterequi]|uniref:Pyridoxal phosphate homeostasis protein n=1 Tax=Corynebacterium uterequi TaxID=1072256 RepID=A0A0G3HHN7_9CORY|nr:YggS family pyridoxal phosphate-dependent enzyme [Corynebacterium uterequi]AKK11453.1 pyridoxal phosphate enzyme, YggS family [Corynebacterium uterequi]
MNRATEISERLERVRARIREAEVAAGRAPGSVTLLPVTKFHPAEDVAVLSELGVTAVGENREQEARAKAAAVPEMDFHMIGQVQTKKANAVARWAAACHSVDSVRLAEGLNRGVALALERGERTQGVLDCFVQWSADGDTRRGGTAEPQAVAEAIAASDHLRFVGIMVVPPIGADPARVFAEARRLADGLGPGMALSAGMSADLVQAIAAGSDLVRVGTDILGPRPVG